MKDSEVSVGNGPGRGNVTGRRSDVLAALRESADPLSIAELAEQLGLHPNTVRFHLDTLTERDQAERIHAASTRPGRPPLVFRARRGMDAAGPRNYRLLAGILVDSIATGPDPVAKAIEAGRDWGQGLADQPGGPVSGEDHQAVGRLVGVLDELGFAPERRSSADGTIGLRHCPFLDLVPAQSEVVCPVHLGLMQGAMAAMGSSVTVERLEPFVEPDLCLAHLGGTAREES